MKKLNRNYDYYDVSKINNFYELLKLHLENNSDDYAFSYKVNDKIVNKTYKNVYDDVINLSGYFYKNYKNKHIALIGENSYNYIIAFMAIVLSGNVCVLLDKDLNQDIIEKNLKISDTKIVYYSKNYCTFIKDINCESYYLEDIEKYVNVGKKYKNNYQVIDDKGAVIFFTSGTTGANKAVVLSQKSIVLDIYGAASLYKPSGSVVSFLPFHHSFGLITGVLKPFYYGVNVYLNNSFKYLLKDLKENSPDTIFVVPAFIETFYKQIWKSVRVKKKDKLLKRSIKMSNFLLKINIDLRRKLFKEILDEFGGKLNYIICGGAYLDKKYVKWFRSIGIKILNGYGITECSPVVSVNRNLYGRDGSVGQICRGVSVKIIDDEICVKGPIVMKEYYKDKKATKEVLIQGYFHTGDLGYIDEDGFLFITGRKKNIIVLSNGENISPEIIESELLKDEAVLEVVVYAQNNRIIASIYPNEEYLGNQEYFDKLIYNYNKGKPKNHQIAFAILRNKEFIKNNNGKILRDKVLKEDNL